MHFDFRTIDGFVFDWQGTLVKSYHGEPIPTPGALRLLGFLKEKRVKIGLVSNQEKNSLLDDIRALEWTAFFDHVVGLGDVMEPKPSPLPLLLCLRHMGLKPSPSIMMVGDSAADIACAKAAFCTPVWLHHTSQNLEHTDAYATRDCLSFLTNIKKIF